MARGESAQTKVHLRGKEDDYLIFIDDAEAYQKWQLDKSIPITDFISTFRVFVTHKQGAQGTYDEAARGLLDREFGSQEVDIAINHILEKGTLKQFKMPERQGPTNDTRGAMVAH